MTESATIEKRVAALETAQNETAQTLRWVVAKLGRVVAVQDEHTLRLEELRADISALRKDMPGIVAEALRDVLGKRD